LRRLNADSLFLPRTGCPTRIADVAPLTPLPITIRKSP
jgi:hypothetical protein